MDSVARKPSRTAAICLLLAGTTLAAYWPVHLNGFVEFDDPDYVTTNAHVQHGLSWEGFAWAFRTRSATNWHPVTWLSHMLDVQLFGLHAGGHHGMSVGLHIANAVLLFLLWQRMTGMPWRSASVAALFALHPLHVESVAWVAERKDLLSAGFGLLCLRAYIAYARSAQDQRTGATVAPGSKGRFQNPRWGYALALVCYILGLMSKPMLVTWPFVLLLLDYWPLRRFEPSRVKGLVLEKLPFFACAAVSCALTLLVQQQAMLYHKNLSVGARAANGVVACARYLGKAIWPHDLVVLYPHPGHWPALPVLGAALLLLAISGLAIVTRRTRPYLLVGWCWFLGMLVPVLGLVQVGVQSMADRYTYLPLIGVFVMSVWAVGDWLDGAQAAAWMGRALAAAAMVACAILTWSQTHLWRDTETLFTYAAAVTRDNWVAQYKLALVALDRYQTTQRGAMVDQRLVPASGALAPRADAPRDDLSEVLAHCQAALQIEPGLVDIHVTYAKALTEAGRIEEARHHLESAVRLDPHNAEARQNLAEVLYRLGHARGAVAEYEQTLETKPDWEPVLNNLAWLLATHPDASIRNGAEAVRLAQRACELTGYTNLWFLHTLAAAYAERGNFTDAVDAARKACELAAASGEPAVSNTAAERLTLYRTGKPLRQP